MIFQMLFLEFLIGGLLLGGLVAYRKSLGERIVLLATVPIAYLVAFLLLRLGVFDFIGSLVVSALSGMEGLSELLADSAATASGIAALINSVVRPLLMVPIFWILLLDLRIVYAIVAKASHLKEKAAFFRPAAKNKVWKNLGVAAIGAVGGFVICMLSLLPVTYFSNLIAPALDTMHSERYNGTYVQAQTETVNATLLPLAKHTVPGALQTYTGLRFVMDATVDGLGEVSLLDNSGHRVSFNGTRVVQTIAKDGATAAAIYEFTCHPSSHTLADLAPIADILSDLAHEDALAVIGSELLSGNLPAGEEDDGTLTGQLMGSLLGEYTAGDAAVLQGDLEAVSSLVALLAEDLGSVSLDDGTLAEEVLAYLGDEEAAYRVVNALSHFHVYGDVFGMLAEYGVDALGEALNVSGNRADHHDAYVADVVELLNDRASGIYDADGVDAFIRYAAANGIAVGSYVPNEAYPSVTDTAYLHYARYFHRQQALEAIIATYTNAATGNSYYLAMDGKLYEYDQTTDTWLENTDPTALCAASHLARELLYKANAVLLYSPDSMITEADVLTFVADTVTDLSSNAATYAAATRALAATLTDASSADFAPDAIYRDDITGCLNTDVTFDEEQNRHFAKVVSSACTLLGSIMDAEGEDALESVISEFGSIGRLLDGLASFEMTEKVPEKMLGAIMQHPDYGKYFDSDSIATLIEKVEAGTATYESLFESVKALYGIINQIIPQS